MRAFALRVDVASGVSGFVRPGDRVDVYWTGRPPGRNEGEFTKLIDTNVRIIAIDQTADEDRNSPLARTVTVEATPQQVASLAQAQATGRLSALPRGRRRPNHRRSVVQVDQRSLLGIERERRGRTAAGLLDPDPPRRRDRRGSDRVHELTRFRSFRRTPHLGCVPSIIY
jgi:pilus assembly protein CpaB